MTNVKGKTLPITKLCMVFKMCEKKKNFDLQKPFSLKKDKLTVMLDKEFLH